MKNSERHRKNATANTSRFGRRFRAVVLVLALAALTSCDYKSPSETSFFCSTSPVQTVTEERLNELQEDAASVEPGEASSIEVMDSSPPEQTQSGEFEFAITVTQCNATESDDDTVANTAVFDNAG